MPTIGYEVQVTWMKEACGTSVGGTFKEPIISSSFLEGLTLLSWETKLFWNHS